MTDQSYQQQFASVSFWLGKGFGLQLMIGLAVEIITIDQSDASKLAIQTQLEAGLFFRSLLQRRCCVWKLPASNGEPCSLFLPFQICFDLEVALRRVFKDTVTQMSPWVSVYDVLNSHSFCKQRYVGMVSTKAQCFASCPNKVGGWRTHARLFVCLFIWQVSCGFV